MMKVGFLQFAPQRAQPEKNIARMASLLSGMKDALVVTPELATSGYLFPGRKHAAACAFEAGSPAFDPLKRVSEENGLLLAVGFAERDGSGLFNSLMLLDGGRTLSVYRKIHLFEREKKIFDPGDRPPPVVGAGAARAGLMICWDWYFPETARFLARNGAQVILHAANLVLPWCMDAMRTRSIENRVFTVTCNRTGSEEIRGVLLSFNGRSQAVAQDGERLLAAGSGTEGAFVVEIDPAAADDKSLSPSNRGMLELRADILS